MVVQDSKVFTQYIGQYVAIIDGYWHQSQCMLKPTLNHFATAEMKDHKSTD